MIRHAYDSDMMHSRIAAAMALLWALVMTGDAPAAPRDEAVRVERQYAVRTKQFDPDNPPSNMPPLQPPEAAVTVSSFSCSSQMRVIILSEEKRANSVHAKAQVESVKLTIGLDVTIWLPTDATRKIKVHEDGHRDISDHYFAQGQKVARELAKPYVGKIIEGTGPDTNAAVDGAIKAAIRELGGKYMAQIEARAGKAQQVYDELTDHGRNDLKEDQAVEQAIAETGE